MAPLDAERSRLIRQRAQAADLDDTDPLDAVLEILQDFPEDYPDGWWLDPAHSRWWLSLHVDWKAPDEVEWQVQAISRTLELDGLFVSQAAKRTGAQVPEVLAEAAEWIRQHGYELLLVETGGDEYLALPVRQGLLEQVVAMARELELGTHPL